MDRMLIQSFVARPVNWFASRAKLEAIRRTVFIEEQEVPEAEEWDGLDESAYHVLAVAGDDVPVGTGRLLLTGRIGRMAVLKPWRRRGVGGAILQLLLDLARKEGLETVELHAQTHALRFYAAHGFTAYGKTFEEAGILHRAMRIRLEPQQRPS
jgi:predicted GNAT family N-acyltransferase